MNLSIADPPHRDPQRRDRLIAVFRDTFDPAPALDVTQLKYRDIPAWNSVGHMQLVAALEAAFDLMLETDEIIALSSFEEAERILDRHLISFTIGL
ncbi:MAG: acyl carrier protein [Rhodospirillaceae bacterium]